MKIILSTLNAKYIHSSLALRYLKAYNEQDFPDIEIAEYSIKEPQINILSDLYQKEADIIGFSCYIWNIEETIELVRLLKKVKPDLIIVLGGPEVSYDIEYWLKRVKEIDYIVIGEGEASFNKLLKALSKKTNLKSVSGIAYKDNDGYNITPSIEKIELDSIPSPYQDQADLLTLQDKIVYYEASRGCPFSCAYCLSSIETGVRYFSIERVKDDLLRLIQAGVKIIKFVDRTFNIHKKYAMEIFKFLIDNHQGTIFQFEITADIMKDDVLQYLIDHAPADIFRFEIGVQSTNDATNSLVKRRQNFQKLSRTVEKLRDTNKIDQHLDLIAGLPEEDYASFRRTFNDVFALRAEELQLGFLKMLRGTALWLEADKYGYLYMDKAPYEMLQNNVLSFADVVRIKRVEDVLDKYWNAHRMDRTIDYLISNVFETPFDFFQAFGDYWEQKGWNRIGHQLEALFERLYQFLNDMKIDQLDFVLALMKLDYFSNHQYKPRKTWWDTSFLKQEQSQWFKELINDQEFAEQIVQQRDLNERDLHKHVMVDVLNYDLNHYFQTGDIMRQPTLLAIYYQAPQKPRHFLKRI